MYKRPSYSSWSQCVPRSPPKPIHCPLANCAAYWISNAVNIFSLSSSCASLISLFTLISITSLFLNENPVLQPAISTR